MSIKTLAQFLGLVFTCLWCGVYAFGSRSGSQIDLTKSFKLKVYINVERDGEHNSRYTFEEAYSSQQKRTKITYATQGQERDDWLDAMNIPAAGGLIASNAGILLWSLMGSEPSKCRQLSQGNFRRLCSNQVLYEIARNLLEGENVIRGPSAVLLLVEQFHEKLKRVNIMTPSVRNTPSVMFGYLSDKFQLHCLYSIEQVQLNGEHLESQLPLRVILDLPNGLHWEYNFLHYESQVYDRNAHYSSEGLMGPLFDEFSIERATGCSAYASAMQQAEEGQLFPNSDMSRSFSFTATLPESIQGEETSCKVAYLDELGVMRVDSKSGAKTTILQSDFNLGTAHHVLERTGAHEQKDAALDQLMAPAHLNIGDASRSCILVESPMRHKSDFLKLLAGATSRSFIHLGQARVRGIWTHAYEAYNTTWPSWLVQPLQYTKHGIDPARAKQVPEASYHDFLETGMVFSTVVYLSQGVECPRLVQLETYRMYHETKRVLTRVSIPVLDFSWSTAQVDLRSLSIASKCPNESEHHGQVVLLLTSRASDTPPPDWLRDNQLRDLALLEAIQSQLQIPSSIIELEDFNSRLIEVATSSGLGAMSMLKVTFGFVLSNRRLVAKLTFYGPGRVKKLYQFNKLYKSEQSSLEACFYLAAHRKLDYFFAYSRHDSTCIIDFGPDPLMPGHYGNVSESVHGPQAKAFEFDPVGPIGIYFVHHDELKSNSGDLLSQLHVGPVSRSGITNSQLMRMVILDNPDNRASHESFRFIVQSLEFVDLDGVQQPFRIDDVSLENTNKFVNFGLVPDGQLASRAQNDQLTDIEGCRAACLTSTACKAYSWCFSGASTECVLSNVDFKSGSDLLLQLIDIQQNRPLASVPAGYRERHVHSLSINASHFVRVKQAPGCVLHNKLYLDMFHKEPRRRQNLGEFSSLKRVDGRDQCAQKCLKMTLEVISEGKSLLAATKAQLEHLLHVHNDSNKTAESAPNAQVETILTSQRNAAKQMCKEFYYLDRVNLQNVAADIREQYQLSVTEQLLTDDKEPRGYCLMMRAAGEKIQTKYNSQATIDGLERYRFQFELLFERKKSVRLLPSKKSPDELNAYLALVSRQVPANIHDLDPLWGLINGHKNSQTNMMMSHMDESTCASICATQITGPWPACKSFDLIVVSLGESGYGKPSAVCLLNSITMQDALDTNQQQQQLIDHSSSLTHVHWHYEPRFFGVQHTSGKTDDVGVASSGEMFMIQRTMYFGLPSTMVMCIFLIGSLTGILMGLNLGIKYSTNLSRAGSGLLSESTADTNQDFSLSIEVGMGSSIGGTMDLHHIVS